MDGKQRIFFIVIAAVMALMLLFPPFQFHGENGAVANAGYHFFLTNPNYENYGAVNISLLLMQWLIVGSIGFIGWFIFKNKK